MKQSSLAFKNKRDTLYSKISMWQSTLRIKNKSTQGGHNENNLLLFRVRKFASLKLLAFIFGVLGFIIQILKCVLLLILFKKKFSISYFVTSIPANFSLLNFHNFYIKQTYFTVLCLQIIFTNKISAFY